MSKPPFTMSKYARREDLLADAAKYYEAECERLQARIDALMLEYCPEEMTPEQLENYEKHQKPLEMFEAR